MPEPSSLYKTTPQRPASDRGAANLEEAMQIAARLESQGRVAEAEARYREIVNSHPEQARAWAALGYLVFLRGNIAEAIQLMEQCVAKDPKSSLFWRNLCELRRRAGMAEGAIAAGRRAVDLAPEDPEGYFNLSLALGDAKQIPEAITMARRLLNIAPLHGRGWNNLGHSLGIVGDIEGARQAFQQAVAIDPGNAEAQHNLAKVVEFLAASERASGKAPESSGQTRGFAEAMSASRLHLHAGRWDEALVAIEEALALEPDNFDALWNYASCLCDLGRPAEAIVAAEQILAKDPLNSTVRFTLAICQIEVGRWKEGWKNYEARLEANYEGKDRLNAPQMPTPKWKGQTGASEQSILIVCEQGFGDSVQFSRYLPLLLKRFARVGVLASVEVARLLDWTFGAEIVVLSRYSSDDDCWDWHCMIMSLPFAFGTEPDTIPRKPAYLHVPSPAREYWRKRLATRSERDLKVGLTWTGRPTHRFNRDRSISFDELSPLVCTEGVTFVCLQRREDLVTVPTIPPDARWVDWTLEMGDFSTTAALVSNLDLVIGIDSVIVHLAGALGIPVWMMNRRNSEWRWMAPRDDSPWYPTMRIFGQSAMGNWSDVVARVKEELRVFSRSR